MKPTITFLVMSIFIFFKSFSQVNYTESFDGTTFVPTGWTNLLVSGTNTWTRVTVGSFPTQTPHSGAGEAQFNSFSVSGGVRSLVSPVINYANRASAATSISFWMYRDNGYNTTADKIDVYMNTAANLTGATLIGTVNRAIGLTPTVTVSGWYQYSFTVPTSLNTATNYFILKATSAYGNNIFIDDVAWTAFPPPYIDMMATALISPNGNFNCFSNNQSVSLQIKNNGSAPINFSVNPVTITCTVNIATSGTLATTSTVNVTPFVLNVGTLSVGATTNIVITSSLNMAINGTYTFSAKTSVTGDVLTSNDAMTPSSLIVSKVASFPYEADFSNIPDPLFLTQQVSGTGLWTNATTGNLTNPTLAPVMNSGNGYAYFNSYSYSSGTVSNLITPSFNMSSVANPMLDLYVSQDNGWAGYNDKLDILVSTDGGVTWSASLMTIQRYNTAYATPGWKLFTVSLFAYAGMPCVRIAIKATSAFGNNMAIDYLRVYNPASSLPIKLVSFDGQVYDEQYNILSWTTAEEVNTKSFRIDRSADGVNFTTVHIEDAIGEETGRSYNYLDPLDSEMPIAYYRLVSVDNDNTTEVFKMISIERTYSGKFSSSLYPNPTEGKTTLEVAIDDGDEVLIEITNAKGDLVSSSIHQLQQGQNKIDLFSEQFGKGIYFIKLKCLSNAANKTNFKLVVI